MLEAGLTYRPHIDGLRAVAVILVFLFHLNPELFPNGYLGVDVFFVISGFVISQSLYKEFTEKKRIRIGQFYLRRLRRLYPALLTMVLITTVLYTVIGFLWNTNVLIKSSLTSIFAVSNFFYLKQSNNYFQQELINPLLHTWSLGIEEQFYFIYPLLLLVFLLLLRKFKLKTYHLGLFFLVLSISLYYIFVTNTDNIWGEYYWPTARFWELGAGCTLFFFAQSLKNVILAPFCTLSGFAILGYLNFFAHNNFSVQQETLLAVLASTLIIYAGLNLKQTNWGIRLLAAKQTVYTGNLSYSLYLWHMPVIYFMALYTAGFTYYLLTTVLTIIMAILSYHLVEKPLRFALWLNKVFITIIGGTIIILVLLTLLWGPKQLINNTNDSIKSFIIKAEAVNYIEQKTGLGTRIQPDFDIERVVDVTKCVKQARAKENYDLTQDCFTIRKNDAVLYLTGDSHATHYEPMLANFHKNTDIYYVRTPRSTIVNWNWNGAPVDTELRIKQRQEELIALKQNHNEVYLMLSMYFRKDTDQIDIIEKNLSLLIDELSPYAKIIIVAPTPVWPAGPETCVLLEKKCILNKSEDMAAVSNILNLYQRLALEKNNVYVYNPYHEICAAEECYIYDKKNDHLWYMDDDHLSVEGSIKLTPHFNDWFNKTFK